MSNPHNTNDPSWRGRPATWSKPSTWVIGTVVALAVIFGAAFLLGDRSGTQTAVNPTTGAPPAGAQIAVPPVTTGSGDAR
jgi:hypothetical protein